tara:strand:- start:595 stop:918 length:324 start_codon:yes stop_codon:yes gene_type:complete
MAGIIKGSINLSNIPKDKIIVGKKGKYLPITVTVNDEPDQFGNQGPICVDQTKEEREAKTAKTYLGNVKVVWTNGEFPERIPFEKDGYSYTEPPKKKPVDQGADLPF